MNQTDIERSTILIVDDTPASIDVLVEALERVEFRLLVAQSADEVFERIANIRPDIILLDILMPGTDGFEVCRRLKADEDTKDIPVLFMTALSDTSDKIRGFELGAADYITKPFQHEEVLARIKAHLTIRKLQQDLNDALVRRSKRQMEELRQNIIASLPHEFYTPLNGIFGFANIIVETHDRMSKESIVEYVRFIYESAERLHRTIQNYLTYAEIEIIASNPEQVKKCQNGTMSNSKVQIEYIAKENAVRAKRMSDLVIESEAVPVFTIPISESYFHKLMQELIENAFKFSNAGTKVHIRTAIQDDKFRIYISDKGRGMSAEQIAEVGAYMQFERRIYEQQGTGLGLIIAKRLAEIHKGRLTVESGGKNHGVRYIVEFPVNFQDYKDDDSIKHLQECTIAELR